MAVSIILAHPNPHSLNHAIAAEVVLALQSLGKSFHFHDLYAEGFDPVIPGGEIARDAELPGMVRRHCEEIGVAEGIVVVHPNWWGSPPGILKGWVDRVIRPGVAYEFLEGDGGEGVPQGLLAAKCAVVLNTSNTKKEREMAVFGDPLELFWKDCVFGLCGVTRVRRRMFETVVTSSLEERKGWLREVREIIIGEFGG